MYEVKIDLKRNRLYMTMKGFFKEEEAKEMADDVIAEVKKLKPGYTIINDISECKPAQQEAFLQLKRSHEFVAEHGAKRIIRVLGNPISAMQFRRAQREAQTDLEIVEVTSLQEAEQIINEG